MFRVPRPREWCRVIESTGDKPQSGEPAHLSPHGQLRGNLPEILNQKKLKYSRWPEAELATLRDLSAFAGKRKGEELNLTEAIPGEEVAGGRQPGGYELVLAVR